MRKMKKENEILRKESNILRNMVNEMQIKNDLLSTKNKLHEQELDTIIEKMNEYYKLINSCNIPSMGTESDVNGDLASCRTRIQKIIKDSKKTERRALFREREECSKCFFIFIGGSRGINN